MAYRSGPITRRGVISAAAALCMNRAHAAPPWTRAAYEKAMRDSGRPVSLTDAQFDAIQQRKPAAQSLDPKFQDELIANLAELTGTKIF